MGWWVMGPNWSLCLMSIYIYRDIEYRICIVYGLLRKRFSHFREFIEDSDGVTPIILKIYLFIHIEYIDTVCKYLNMQLSKRTTPGAVRVLSSVNGPTSSHTSIQKNINKNAKISFPDPSSRCEKCFNRNSYKPSGYSISLETV